MEEEVQKPKWLTRIEWGVRWTEGSTLRGLIRLLLVVSALGAYFAGKYEAIIPMMLAAEAIKGFLGAAVKER